MADRGARTWLWLGLHYLEMVVAMMAGMLLTPLVAAPLPDGAASRVIAMTVAMSLGMGGWMLIRGHGARHLVEMTACMVGPGLLALPALAFASEGLVMVALHVAMFGAMAAVVIVRRDHYGHRPHPQPRRWKWLRRGAIGAAAVGLAVLPVGLGMGQRLAEPYAMRTDRPALPAPVTAVPDDGKPVAVILTGNRGAEIGDVLGPFQVLSSTGRYHVLTVAPQRNPLPLTGGLDLVPDLSFAGLDRALGGRAPDLVVVPAMPDLGQPSNEPARAWLARQHERGALTLGVCVGARLVAAAGLLHGRPATSHWIRLAGLESDFADTDWRRGVRWVDDGDVVTTGGILSGVDGALHVVERQFGAATAAAAAHAVGWRGWRPGPAAALPPSGVRASDAAVMIRAGYDRDRPTIGIRLHDGTDELALAAAFDTWNGQSYAARTIAVAGSITPVRSAHGLTFLPRATEAAVDADRVLDPPSGPGFPFDGTLRQLARDTDVPTAIWAAKLLEYPTGGLDLDGPAWPWALTLRPLAVIALVIAAAAALPRIVRLIRGRAPGRAARPASGPVPRVSPGRS